MKNYKIDITPNAHEDLAELYRYVALNLGLPDTANQLYDKISSKIYRLAEFPKRNPPVESEPEKSEGLRILPVGSYSVLYVVDEDTVFVKNIAPSSSQYIARLRGFS